MQCTLFCAYFRLLESLQSFLDEVEISNSTMNQTVFAFKTFALQVQTLDSAEYQGQTFSVDLGSVEEALKLDPCSCILLYDHFSDVVTDNNYYV